MYNVDSPHAEDFINDEEILDTLKYIYYECFDKEADDYKLMLKSLIKEILQNNYIINNKIYNILKPISTN